MTPSGPYSRPHMLTTDDADILILNDRAHPGFVLPGSGPGRCRITPPPPAERPDAVTPDLARLVLDQIVSYAYPKLPPG
jgi:hypothetical protein